MIFLLWDDVCCCFLSTKYHCFRQWSPCGFGPYIFQLLSRQCSQATPQKNMSFLFNFLGIPINPVLDPSVSKSLEGSTRSSLISCSAILQKPELVAVAIVFWKSWIWWWFSKKITVILGNGHSQTSQVSAPQKGNSCRKLDVKIPNSGDTFAQITFFG